MTVVEDYSDCTVNQEMIQLHNDKKQSRSVKIAIADPSGNVTEITDDIYDGIGGQIVSIDTNSETVDATVGLNTSGMTADASLKITELN